MASVSAALISHGCAWVGVGCRVSVVGLEAFKERSLSDPLPQRLGVGT
jgi:hypothetical protein